MTPSIYSPGRYEVRAEIRFFVWDTLLEKNSSSHDTEKSAVTRAYILNRFSTGAGI